MSIMDAINRHLQHLLEVLQNVQWTSYQVILAGTATAAGAWYLGRSFLSPLRRFPGPRLAAWTNFYRVFYAYKGNIHVVSKNLHEKYGPVVRMSPTYLDIDDVSLVKTCFDVKGVWQKTFWHAVGGVLVDGHVFYNVFTEVRAPEHARMRKPVAKYFSPTGVAPLEPHVDAVVATLAQRFSDRFGGDNAPGSTFDFGEWMTFFSWDVVAKTTFSEPVGYLDKGYDFDGSLGVSEKAMDYLVTIGMYPALDKLFDKNPLVRIGPPTFGAITNLGLGRLLARMKGEDNHDPAKPDFLDRYLEAHQDDPEYVDIHRLLSYILMNLAAGADTVALSLRTAFYMTLMNPRIYQRLESEILAADFTSLPVSYAEARKLPYLDAVIRESFRYLPGNCFAQERLVPAGGLELSDGSFVPAGTEIGFNAYVMHRNKAVWGEDAEEFVPERWLPRKDESDEAFKARLLHMNNSDMSFSAGSRKCIGMNIGKTEVYKTTATLFKLFKLELANPDKEWSIHCSIFPRQSGVEMKLTRRKGTELALKDMDMNY